MKNARERVVVAMSGGVDSSVAAALLVEQGYDVVGLMLRLWSDMDNGGGSANRCCAPDAQYDAARVAEVLDIPFYLVNASSAFKVDVVDPFISEYASGRTPNPCVECNRNIRFDLLLKRALALNAIYLATGHYARVRLSGNGYQLWRGLDGNKDQSYVLHVLGQSQLAHVIFPIGDYTKQQVRELAYEHGLDVAQRKDSQDLCFVQDGDYRQFLAQRVPNAYQSGPIMNRAGQILGQHQGLANYTIGQRRGIGISGQEKLYVLELNAEENVLIVGTARELGRDSCLAVNVNWVGGAPPASVFPATAKIRYRAKDVPAMVTAVDDNAAHVSFDAPQRDIAPGQAVVLYLGKVVLGGGTISLSDAHSSARHQESEG